MRVLGRLRLSRSTEESTSIERQREIIQQWATTNDHTIVGWAEDIDVSGSVDPFDTPQLGEWLSHRAPEWDILCSWKLDRLGRNAIQLNKLFGWCNEHGKTVVSCSESIDLSNWAGRMLANVIAGLAEGELEAIRERQRSSKQKLRETARWSGGKPPYGYLGVPRTDGPGWSLAVDPEAAKVVRRIVDDVLDGTPLTRIATNLTAEGYRTPATYYTAQKANQPALQWTAGERPSGKWAASQLRNMLRSSALRGYAHHNGQTVRDDDGNAVRLAEPLVTLDEWELIQAILDRVQESRRGIRRNEASRLAGVVVCLECGLTLHHDRNTSRGHVYRYYRCQNRDTVMIPAETLETLAEEAFLYEVGDLEVRERVWVPGDSREADLREAVTALDELTKAAGRAVSATAKQRLQRQLTGLDARIAELESAPAREARWEYRPTGGTYRSVWEASDTDARRELLHKSGITIAASISGVEGKRSASNAGVLKFDIRIPAEINREPWLVVASAFPDGA
jgi:DNA invertase Pin-like site-specific DNA recombinase